MASVVTRRDKTLRWFVSRRGRNDTGLRNVEILAKEAVSNERNLT